MSNFCSGISKIERLGVFDEESLAGFLQRIDRALVARTQARRPSGAIHVGYMLYGGPLEVVCKLHFGKPDTVGFQRINREMDALAGWPQIDPQCLAKQIMQVGQIERRGYGVLNSGLFVDGADSAAVLCGKYGRFFVVVDTLPRNQSANEENPENCIILAAVVEALHHADWVWGDHQLAQPVTDILNGCMALCEDKKSARSYEKVMEAAKRQADHTEALEWMQKFDLPELENPRPDYMEDEEKFAE